MHWQRCQLGVVFGVRSRGWPRKIVFLFPPLLVWFDCLVFDFVAAASSDRFSASTFPKMSKRALRDLAKFRGEAKIKSDQEDLYNFVREHVKIEPDEANVRACLLCCEHLTVSVPRCHKLRLV